MDNRPMVMVTAERFEELIRKEVQLELLEKVVLGKHNYLADDLCRLYGTEEAETSAE